MLHDPVVAVVLHGTIYAANLPMCVLHSLPEVISPEAQVILAVQ